MKNIDDYLNGLGLLHDSRVIQMFFDWDKYIFSISIEDIYSNFQGLPGYLGLTPGTIVLGGVTAITIDIRSNAEELKIFEFEVTPDPSSVGGLANIRFSPAGSVSVKFHSAQY